MKWTGIPVSIGIAKTKTLAKAANELAKKQTQFNGVLNLNEYNNLDILLEKLEVSDVWGIGRKFAHKLSTIKNVSNAKQFKDLPDDWIKSNMSISGLRTAFELRGISCISFNHVNKHRKSILTSKSFGYSIKTLNELEEAVSSYVCRAAEKLRTEKLAATYVHVFIRTNKFNKHKHYYSNYYTITLPQSTSYNPILIKYALIALKKIFKRDYAYKKAGVLLTGLIPDNQVQLNLFHSEKIHRKHTQLMTTFDTINNTYGSRTLRYATTGLHKPWHLKQENRSPRYTTKWQELYNIIL